MKLLIYWYSDGDARTRKFLRREVVEAPHSAGAFFIAWMTEGKVWKNYALRRVSQSEFEEKLRKLPAEPGAT